MHISLHCWVFLSSQTYTLQIARRNPPLATLKTLMLMFNGKWKFQAKYIYFRKCRPNLRHAQSTVQCVSWAFTLGVKFPVREAHYLPQSNSEVKHKHCYSSKCRLATWESVIQLLPYLLIIAYVDSLTSHHERVGIISPSKTLQWQRSYK
jgi:zinc transporter ZupT